MSQSCVGCFFVAIFHMDFGRVPCFFKGWQTRSLQEKVAWFGTFYSTWCGQQLSKDCLHSTEKPYPQLNRPLALLQASRTYLWVRWRHSIRTSKVEASQGHVEHCRSFGPRKLVASLGGKANRCPLHANEQSCGYMLLPYIGGEMCGRAVGRCRDLTN